MKRSIQTAIALFAAVTTTLCFTGCANPNHNTQSEDQKIDYDENGNARLKDDKGNPYTLHKNPDGTETARYDDGKEVTFRRDPNTNEIHYESGAASLLTGMLAGYFLFHGFGNSGSSFNSSNFNHNPRTNTYTASEPLQKLSPEEKRRRTGQAYIPSSSANNTSKSNVTSSSNSGTSSNSSTSGSVSQPKSGFGGAGARGGAS